MAAPSIGSWVGFTNGSDPDGSASIDAGSNRKFVLAVLGELDLGALVGPTITVGGQSPDYNLSSSRDIASGAADLYVHAFVWDEATIGSMSGTDISWSDGITFSKISWGYVTIQNTTQAADPTGNANTSASATTLDITWSSATDANDRVIALGITNTANRGPIGFDTGITSRLQYEVSDYAAGVGDGVGGGDIASVMTVTTDEAAAAPMVVMGLAFAPVAAASMSIDSVGPADLNIIYDEEILVEIDGSGFGASQGTGAVTLNDTDPETTTPSVTVAQTETSWADDLIVFTVDKGALASNLVWLGVTDDGASASASKQITVRDAVPELVARRSTPTSKSIALGEAFSFDASNYFYSGDSQDRLAFSISGQPAGLSISSSGLISGTISDGEADNSPFTVTVTVTDRTGTTADDEFTWTVTGPTPDPPTESPTSARKHRPRGGRVAVGRCGRA